MKIEDLLQALPSKEDIAGAVGLQPRSSSPGDMIAAFGTGIFLGAALAMLFAPKAGKEIRHDIGAKLDEISEHIQSQASETALAVRESVA